MDEANPRLTAPAQAQKARQHRRNILTISCPHCGTEAMLDRADAFHCLQGHRTYYKDVEFTCSAGRCNRTAKLTDDWLISCGRHVTDATA